MRKNHEKIIYKNKNGMIIRFTDYWGNNKYCLFNSNGQYVKDIPVPFRVGDYL